MNLQLELHRLREVEWRDLDLKEAGTWPPLLQGLCCLLVLLLTLVGTYWYLALPEAEALQRAEAEERQLLADYRNRAAQAARLPGMLERQISLEAQMTELMGQLPAEDEVSALIDSISESAFKHRVSVDFIRLGNAFAGDYYLERPLDLHVEGSYHDIAAFLASVAALPRIVTLHDFTLMPVEGDERLRLEVLARTYSEQSQGEGEP